MRSSGVEPAESSYDIEKMERNIESLNEKPPIIRKRSVSKNENIRFLSAMADKNRTLVIRNRLADPKIDVSKNVSTIETEKKRKDHFWKNKSSPKVTRIHHKYPNFFCRRE